MSMGRPRISVILVNYNNTRETLACLRQLAAQTFPSFEVIVVENASPREDQRVALKEGLRGAAPNVKVLWRTTNDGYAGGNNAGIQRCRGDLICLLNSDTVFDESFLAWAAAFGDAHTRVGIYSPLIRVYKTRRVWAAGAVLRYSNPRLATIQQSERGWPRVPFATDMVPGCAMIVRRTVLRRIGLLDPNYFMYYEDSDLCYRARQAGWVVALDPQYTLHHDLDEDSREFSPFVLRYHFRNHVYFGLKHATGIQHLAAFGSTFVQFVLYIVSFRTKAFIGHTWTKLRAIAEGAALGLTFK
jgi:GT2 family glycosyltransferase